MEINKSSWHYKLWQTFGSERSINRLLHTTCSYLRGVGFAMLRLLFITIMILFILSAMVSPISLLFGAELIKGSLITGLIVSGCLVWLMIGVAGLCVALQSAIRKFEKRQELKLIEKMLDDKKNGICSVVTFID